jgi:DNA repair photolyase
MTKKTKNLPTISSEVIKEAQKWVVENKGLSTKNQAYDSPRISSELPDCSMPLTFDQYNFCSLGCLYCFAYFFKTNNPAIRETVLKQVDVKNMVAAMKGESTSKKQEAIYNHFYSKKFLLHWGGLADPFCNFEKKNWAGYDLISELGKMNYPTLFSFKGNGIFERKFINLFETFSSQSNFAFQVSIITYNEEIAKLIEIGVPLPKKRIEAIRMLSEMGYWTILRLRPFIIGISDRDLDQLLEESLNAGIRAISLEFFAADIRSNIGMRSRYKFIEKIIGTSNLVQYFSKLSPKERGGYMRLNRLVKEPYVKQIYKFCVENNLVFGCSDPDFKELNMSGSCCAMPDVFPKNNLLENWSRDQLTYHIKELRRKYHKTNEKGSLNFSEVYGNKASYLDDQELANDNVGIIGRCNAVRTNIVLRDMLREKWNNLKSPANPRNYLHGQIMPYDLDDNGDLKYMYSPSDYEQRWKDEGIDLTK